MGWHVDERMKVMVIFFGDGYRAVMELTDSPRSGILGRFGFDGIETLGQAQFLLFLLPFTHNRICILLPHPTLSIAYGI